MDLLLLPKSLESSDVEYVLNIYGRLEVALGVAVLQTTLTAVTDHKHRSDRFPRALARRATALAIRSRLIWVLVLTQSINRPIHAP